MKELKRQTIMIICIIAFSLMLVHCGEPEIAIPDYTPKIAVDGYIEAGHPPVMYLTYSSSFISDYDSMDFVDMVKFNVSAYVITEEDDTIGFTRHTNTSKFPPFEYTMAVSDLRGEAGKTYKLFISKVGDEDITATTSIPLNPPSVVDLIFESSAEMDTLGTYKLSLENSKQNLFYFIENKKIGESDFYPIRFPVKSNRLYEEETLSYYLRDAGTSNLSRLSETEDSLDSDGEKGLYSSNDTVIFKISSLDASSFEVLSSVFLDTEFPDNPFKPISQLPISNVSNGIGRWTGINSIIRVGEVRP